MQPVRVCLLVAAVGLAACDGPPPPGRLHLHLHRRRPGPSIHPLCSSTTSERAPSVPNPGRSPSSISPPPAESSSLLVTPPPSSRVSRPALPGPTASTAASRPAW